MFHRYRSFLEIIHHPWRFNPRWCLVEQCRAMPVPGTQLTEGLSICMYMLTFAQTDSWNTAKYEKGYTDIISIYTSLHLQTLRKSATTKEHILSKNDLSQDAEIPKSLSLVLLYWVQLKFSQWMFFVKGVHDGSWQFPTGIPREFQGSMDTKGLHPNQPSSGLLCVIIRLFCRVLSPFWNSW